MPLVIQRDKFRAMGCAVEVEILGDDQSHVVAGVSMARVRIAELEGAWSRFLPESDISRLNAAQGAMVPVRRATIKLLDAMVQGYAVTGGGFDPTLLAPLVALGYDASWSDPRMAVSLPAGVAGRGDVNGIAVDPVAAVAQLPSGTVLDAGGIGKGLAADMVVDELLDAGFAGAMVSIGGDLRVAGVGPHQGGWVIAVGDAFHDGGDGHEAVQLSVANAGLATSGTRHRAWHDSNGVAVHHLLDPVTCRPVQATVQATVVAGTAAWAEVFTKLLMVRGITGLDGLDVHGLAGRLVLVDGSTHCNDSWRALELSCIRN
ncbi:FAD:protein FMN transferase [soil metagenome]